MRRLLFAFGALALAGSVCCCNGSDSNGTDSGGSGFDGCESVIAEFESGSGSCGGNLVGNWEVDYWCFTGEAVVPFQDDCSTATGSIQRDYSGSASFDSSTARLELQVTSEQNLEYPQDCFPLSVLAEDCTELQDFLTVDGLTEANCSVESEVCKCAVTSSQGQSIDETYTKYGNGVLDIGAGEFMYCVRGSQMALADDDGNILVLNKT